MIPILSQEQKEQFEQDGFLLLKGFYDVKEEIEPIHRAIYNIIGLLIDKHQLSISRKPFSQETFDAGYQELIAHDRKLGGEVYDAVKQIPAFIRLCASGKNEQLLAELRDTDMPGIAAGGYGIRINNPFEEQFRAEWHQEYPGQLRSPDGIVLWTPLVNVTEEMGPVQICPTSQQEGIVPVHTSDPNNPSKTGAYALILQDQDKRIEKYPVISPLTMPGDLLVIDFLTLHASGHNKSNRSLWSMQIRYFNFRNPTGIQISWKGSFAAGIRFQDVHPELVAS